MDQENLKFVSILKILDGQQLLKKLSMDAIPHLLKIKLTKKLIESRFLMSKEKPKDHGKTSNNGMSKTYNLPGL